MYAIRSYYVSSSVVEVAHNAAAAATEAENSREHATSGNQTVIKVEREIGAIDSQFSVLEAELTDLAQQVEGIKSVMTDISDIADQTNLLALNARNNFV